MREMIRSEKRANDANIDFVRRTYKLAGMLELHDGKYAVYTDPERYSFDAVWVIECHENSADEKLFFTANRPEGLMILKTVRDLEKTREIIQNASK